MHHRQRQATLQRQDDELRNFSNSQRRTARYTELGPGSFSAPVARLSKWPKNIFFASDFIADKAAASKSIKNRATKLSRATGGRRSEVAPRKKDRRSRANADAKEPRLNKKGNTSESTDGRKTSRRSTQGLTESDRKRSVVVAGEEEASFMERSARALLLLHSRFFGSVTHWDDIVCCMCKLCKEAGWMGNPLRECPDLDPLVLDELLTKQQAAKVVGESGRQGRSSDTCPETKVGSAMSFEDLYRILATIASLVYPRDAEDKRQGARRGRAMQRLLIEGVLPLAADNRPRRWSLRPEILYGRPALAALSMQRDTLHQLYCTSDDISRANGGSGGVSRNLFLQMLADLGICPGSVSENHAASVFNDAMRNGMPEAKASLRHKQGQSRDTMSLRGTGDGSNHSTELIEPSTEGCFTRQPEDDRLDWSLFLEAMAALAVGAVKDGQGTPTNRDRIRTHKAKPRHWNKARRDCDIQERPRAARKAAPSWTEQPSFPGRRGSNPAVETDCMSVKRAARMERAVRHVLGDAAAGLAPGMPNPKSHGRAFHYDPKRSLELMTTLPEGSSPQEERIGLPVQSRPRHSQPKPSRVKEGTSVKVSTSATRTFEPLPPEINTPTKEEYRTVTPKCLDSETRGTGSIEGRTRCKMKYRSIKEPHSVVTQAVRGELTSRRVAELSALSPQRSDEFLLQESSVRGGQSCARVANEGKETEDRTAKSNATNVARCPTVDDHATAIHQRVAGDTLAGFQADFARSKENILEATLDGSPAPIRGRTPSSLTEDFPIVADTDGRHGSMQKGPLLGAPRPIPLRPNTPPETRSDGVAGDVVGVSSQRTGVDVESRSSAVNVGTWAYCKPATAHFLLPQKQVDGKNIAALSPAPCHGGPPSALFYSALPVAGERLDGAVYCASPDKILRPAAVTALGADDTETDKPLRPPRVQGQLDELRPGRDGAETSGYRSGDRNSGGHCHVDGDVPAEDDRAKRHQEQGHKQGYADRITMDLEATSCTAKMFEELLEPGIAAVYLRHYKDLQVIFQRYRTRPDGENRRPASESQEIFGCVDDSGVRRFINDSPALQRWAEGDSILPLILRVSRERGQQRCDKVPLTNISGLSYFGFLEVLTRMAYATHGQQPLQAKLLDFLDALKVHDTTGIRTF